MNNFLSNCKPQFTE